MSSKRPRLDLYPGDLRRDTALQSCSIGARGLWYEILWLMHDGEPYGHLAVEGRPLTDRQVAGLVGVQLGAYRKLAAELLAAGVPEVRGDGCWYNRRMVRDEAVRQARAAGGEKGGNPEWVARGKEGGKVVLEVDGKVYPKDAAEDDASSRAPACAQPSPVVGGGGSEKTLHLPPDVADALTAYLDHSTYPNAVIRATAAILDPGQRPHYPADVVARALREMQAAGYAFKSGTLAKWCARLEVPPPTDGTALDKMRRAS